MTIKKEIGIGTNNTKETETRNTKDTKWLNTVVEEMIPLRSGIRGARGAQLTISRAPLQNKTFTTPASRTGLKTDFMYLTNSGRKTEDLSKKTIENTILPLDFFFADDKEENKSECLKLLPRNGKMIV